MEAGSRLEGTTSVTGRSRITLVRIVLLEMLAYVGRRRGGRNKMALGPAMCESTRMGFHSKTPASDRVPAVTSKETDLTG